MKPLGMTASFQIVRPTRVEDKLWEAVEEAVLAGWKPAQVIQEVREAWTEALRQKASDDDKDFARLGK